MPYQDDNGNTILLRMISAGPAELHEWGIPALNSRNGAVHGASPCVPIQMTVILPMISGFVFIAMATFVIAPWQRTKRGWGLSDSASLIIKSTPSDTKGSEERGPFCPIKDGKSIAIACVRAEIS